MSQLYSAPALAKGYKTTFLSHFAGAPTPALVSELCFDIKSESDKETHEWLGQPPIVEEFRGTRNFWGMTATDYEIENIVYTTGVSASMDDIRRNKTRSITKRVQQMGVRAKSHPGVTLLSQIQAGSTTGSLCYDGAEFYDNTHPIRLNEGATQDNRLAQTGTAVANIITDLGLASAAMLSFKDESGQPFHQSEGMQFGVLYGPSIKSVMETALKATVISSTTNIIEPYKPFLSTAITSTYFYMFCLNSDRKAMIYQPELPAKFTSVESDSSETVMRNRQYLYGAELAYGMGYGFWQSSVSVGL